MMPELRRIDVWYLEKQAGMLASIVSPELSSNQPPIADAPFPRTRRTRSGVNLLHIAHFGSR